MTHHGAISKCFSIGKVFPIELGWHNANKEGILFWFRQSAYLMEHSWPIDGKHQLSEFNYVHCEGGGGDF